jgi:3-oxoacyl-[acyl-carrier-protein] synthase-3
MIRARIVGAGAALPARVVPNAVIEDRLGLARGWIARTDIEERRVLGNDASLVDLAERAARDALTASGLDPAALDVVIVATTSGPYQFPSLACLLHQRLGLRKQPAFDVAAACAGFPYALMSADTGIRSGAYGTALVVGADCLSTMTDPRDVGTSALFGDGAGAVVARSEDDAASAPGAGRGILACRLRAVSEAWQILSLRAGARRPEEFSADPDQFWMHMDGPEVFRAAVAELVDLTREVLDAAGVRAEDVALVIPHQANGRIIRSMLQLLRIDEGRAFVNLTRYGNTSAASIPIALTEAIAAGRVHDGDLVVLNAVGGGITAGAAVLRW